MNDVKELSHAMLKKAEWARSQVIKNLKEYTNPEIQVGAQTEWETELTLWVFKQQDENWYSIDGRYSSMSPRQKEANYFQKQLKDKEYQEKYDEIYAQKEAERQYWSKIRQQVLERDNYTCQHCEKDLTHKFTIHHILPVKAGGTDHDDNLIAICHGCHQKVEYLEIAKKDRKNM